MTLNDLLEQVMMGQAQMLVFDRALLQLKTDMQTLRTEMQALRTEMQDLGPTRSKTPPYGMYAGVHRKGKRTIEKVRKRSRVRNK